MAAKKRTIVGSPLTPQMLDELGALNADSLSQTPSGQTADTYRIWACHGYRESGNEQVGTLKIQRIPSPDQSTVVLQVTQRIKNDAGIVHDLTSRIECKSDRLLTPVTWQTNSTFHDPDGALVRDLCAEQRGRLVGRTVEIRTGGRKRTFEASCPVTGDWCLLEAVRMMPCRDAAPIALDVLKEMDLLETDHRIAYRGRVTMPLLGEDRDLHHFQQWGRGMLPYDYWLDRTHRLQMFVTLSIAYIRDENAEQSMG